MTPTEKLADETQYLQIGGCTHGAFGQSEALRVRVGTPTRWEWRKLTDAEYEIVLDALNATLHASTDRASTVPSEESKLFQFLRWAMTTGPWIGSDLDGAAVQDKALELGLIVETKYDPDVHGGGENSEYTEPGDIWYVFAEPAALSEPTYVSPEDEPKIDLLAKALAGAELNYRDSYEQRGGGHIETGRRWDRMRRAGDAIRQHFYEIEEAAPTSGK